MVDNDNEVHFMVEHLVQVGRKYRMEINMTKWKLAGISEILRIINIELERVKQFKYLNRTLTEKLDCIRETRERITKAKGVFHLRMFLKGNLNLLKLRS